jgi:hypothetical protein
MPMVTNIQHNLRIDKWFERINKINAIILNYFVIDIYDKIKKAFLLQERLEYIVLFKKINIKYLGLLRDNKFYHPQIHEWIE